ncbi:MAG TPA: hypothetical protein VKK31_11845 [Thermoanaerobaculia bacterium]|nr:hypothetical protein [Thermoanaerobaculia bacterium]
MKAHLTLAFALLLVCTGTGAILAQTPDMLPPSRETVCDDETGAAFGLCNAYCEAMDCELANDSNPGTEPHASATACSKVRTKFQNITGRDVPCELTCPCTSIPEFNATLANAQACVDFLGIVVVSPSPNAFPFPPFFLEYAGSDPVRCGYVNFEANIFNTIPVTPEQAEVCIQLTRDAAANNNVTCQTF